MYLLSSHGEDVRFPPVEEASSEGLLAIGGDLGVERLIAAYRAGIFPWYSDGQPILWWSPDPRAVLYPAAVHVGRGLRRTLRRRLYAVSADRAFAEVIDACAAPRAAHPGSGTWITGEMRAAYCALHRRGVAHSIEVWHDDVLCGGRYGVALGGAFFGESMFSRRDDASKVALVVLARQLQRWGFGLIDCQLASGHVLRMGARCIPRDRFLAELRLAVQQPDRAGNWQLDPDLQDD